MRGNDSSPCTACQTFACSPRAIARIHRGAPWGGRESAAHRARAGRREAAGAARMGRARVGGVRAPVGTREAQIKPWADAKRVPTRHAAWARWAKPCVTQTGRGARHNNTSRPPHTKRSLRSDWAGDAKALLCSIAKQFTPARLPRSSRLDACSTLNYSGDQHNDGG